jgi:GT2 family glycosyltransferase
MTSSAGQIKALLITVNYGSAASLLELLGSLQHLKASSEIEIIIVDNSSVYKHSSRIREAITQIPTAELVELPTNRGYFGAAKFGLDYYLAQGRALPDWVIVCNHDVVIEDETFFEKLFVRDPSTVGVLAPRITIASQAIEQNPFMEERPGWWRQFTMRLYSSAYPLALTWDWLSRRKRVLLSHTLLGMSSPRSDSDGRPIYAAHGAFVIFSRKFFEAGGILDDQLFLFCEEIAIAESCRSLGLQVVYEPTLAVLHNEHQSVGNGMSRRMYHYHRRSVRHVLAKYLST